MAECDCRKQVIHGITVFTTWLLSGSLTLRKAKFLVTWECKNNFMKISMGPDCLSRGKHRSKTSCQSTLVWAGSSGIVSNTTKLLYRSSQKCSYNKCASFYNTKFLDDFYLAALEQSTRTHFKMIFELWYLVESIMLYKRN